MQPIYPIYIEVTIDFTKYRQDIPVSHYLQGFM